MGLVADALAEDVSARNGRRVAGELPQDRHDEHVVLHSRIGAAAQRNRRPASVQHTVLDQHLGTLAGVHHRVQTTRDLYARTLTHHEAFSPEILAPEIQSVKAEIRLQNHLEGPGQVLGPENRLLARYATEGNRALLAARRADAHGFRIIAAGDHDRVARPHPVRGAADRAKRLLAAQAALVVIAVRRHVIHAWIGRLWSGLQRQRCVVRVEHGEGNVLARGIRRNDFEVVRLTGLESGQAEGAEAFGASEIAYDVLHFRRLAPGQRIGRRMGRPPLDIGRGIAHRMKERTDQPQGFGGDIVLVMNAQRRAAGTEALEPVVVPETRYALVHGKFRRQRVRIAVMLLLQVHEGPCCAVDFPALRCVLVVVVIRIPDGVVRVESDGSPAGVGIDIPAQRHGRGIRQLQRHAREHRVGDLQILDLVRVQSVRGAEERAILESQVAAAAERRAGSEIQALEDNSRAVSQGQFSGDEDRPATSAADHDRQSPVARVVPGRSRVLAFG